MDRRVRIIRGWLIVALAIAGALLIDPVLWFGLATILACEPCCGEGPCPQISDAFTGGTIDSGTWDQVSGTWSQSGTLTTSSTNALIITVAGTNGVGGRLQVDIPTASASQTGLRVIGAYTDTSNYIYVELSRGNCSSGQCDLDVALYDRTAGTDTLLEEYHVNRTECGEVTTSVTLRVNLCWNGAICGATVHEVGVDRVAVLSGESTQGGEHGGLGTGGTVANVLFDDFELVGERDDNSNCQTCDTCRQVCTDGLPATVELTLPSDWGNGANCGGTICSDEFNGQTFVCTLLTDTSQFRLDRGATPANLDLEAVSCVYQYREDPWCFANELEIYVWFEYDASTSPAKYKVHALVRSIVNGRPYTCQNTEETHFVSSAANAPITCGGQSFTLSFLERTAPAAHCTFSSSGTATVDT